MSNEITTSPDRGETPTWVETYIGLPFKEHGRARDGVDCWGLVRLVLAEQFKIDLPAYVAGYASTEDAVDIARLIRGEMGPWIEVRDTHPGDAVLMRLRAQPCHVEGGGRAGMDAARRGRHRQLPRSLQRRKMVAPGRRRVPVSKDLE